MGGDGFVNALGLIADALFLVVSVYIYVSLLRQIANRGPEIVTDRRFGLPEGIVALAMASVFAWASLGSPEVTIIKTRQIIFGELISLVLIGGLVLFLKLRQFNLTKLGGLTRLSFRRAFATGFILLLFAYPLIALADWATAHVLGSGSKRQGIIESFSASSSMEERVLIIVLAVVIAPITEEFVFRFFLYGVLRRYAGRAAALTMSALFFAAVHAHLPAFAPLFVLAACFTVAYEWSGSLLVPMTMHALFNAMMLTELAFPLTFSQ